MARVRLTSGRGAVMLLGLWLTGCPNVNTYGTARTTPKGELSHSISAEGFGAQVETTTLDSTGQEQTEKVHVFLPLPPSYHLRVGVADSVDLGFHVNNMSSLGFDGKLNFLKGRIDLAADPGIQWYRYSFGASDGAGNETRTSVNVVYLHGPLLVDFNVNETVSFVVAPGVEYAYVSTDAAGGSDFEVAARSKGVFARFGLGIDIRASERFAIHPEVTVFRNFEDQASLLYMAGIGFNFGHLPSFADVK